MWRHWFGRASRALSDGWGYLDADWKGVLVAAVTLVLVVLGVDVPG